MPVSKDRPLMRDALLAGGVIAASCVATLVSMDRGSIRPVHIGTVATPPAASDVFESAPKSLITKRIVPRSDRAPGIKSQQDSMRPIAATKRSNDMTVVIMVPDLPRENSGSPPTGVWSDQGGAASITGAGPQGAGAVALASTGGLSLPLTSPTGQSSGASLANSGANPGGVVAPPETSGPGGSRAPVGQPQVGAHMGFVLRSPALSRSHKVRVCGSRAGRVTAAPPMRDARTDHTATVLSDGTILVAGGDDVSGRPLSSAEVYDPSSGKFSLVVSKMLTARAEHSATLISGCSCPADGKVLIAGGAASAQGGALESAELYDPATGEFTATGSMKATRARHSATLIASGPLAGNVLVAGGDSDEGGGDVASAELYDPTTGQFTPTGVMGTPRESHSATWLDPAIVTGALAGQVLIAGGEDANVPNDTAEVFNPQTGTFTPVGSMSTPRTLQTAVLLGNGQVLIAGGQSGDNEFLLTAELFNPASLSFAATGSMNNIHVGATAILLENGEVLVAGGRSNLADLYDPVAGSFSSTCKLDTDVAE
jgi:hypothetical protein